MTRSRVASLIVGISAGAVLATVAPAQQSDTSAVWSWVDRYYSDYSAMSAGPTGPAMDRWLAHYAPFAFFEDPTTAFFKDSPAGLSGIGRDTIRKAYLAAFTGPLGPMRWTIQRRISGGDWVAVEGWMDGTQAGKRIRTRFTTWLKIRDGQIVHQIDYMDYAAIRRQVSGTDSVPTSLPVARATSSGRPDANRALRVTDEFYRRYDAMAAVASPAGIARFMNMMTADYTLEDPTARLAYDSAEKMHAGLKEALASNDFGAVHWEIEHRITDGEWIVVEGTWRGIYKSRPFATRFTTWLQVRGDKIAKHIDFIDYATMRRLMSPPKAP
jgi:ketosteroid isomerase-like protein